MPIPVRRIIKQDIMSLLQSEGPLRVPQVYEALADAWSLTAEEAQQDRSGDILFHHEIRFAKQDLVTEGIVAKPEDSGWGIWRLIDAEFDTPDHYPDELDLDIEYLEGSTRQILVNEYERNAAARKACLGHYGYNCAVCGFNFEDTYGNIGKESIHVHHLVEISAIGGEYKIDPVRDLRPICPNCHYIIHMRKPSFTIENVRAMINANKAVEEDRATTCP